MIEVEGLTKQYKSVRAVDDLTFQVKPGMVTGFLGPNGAGKSTTMRMILGLDTPTAGRARINGKHYHELKDPLREVGALLDAKAVHRNRSAANHLKWIAQSNGISTSRVDEVLGLVGLSDVAGKKVGGFSLGMGQRLGLAGALLGDPGILILDEPVNGLDPEGIRWVRSLLRRLADEGRTILVSSHILSEMAQTADNLVVIGRGRLVADTSVNEFIASNSNVTTVVRTATVADLKGLSAAIGQAGARVQRGVDSAQREVLEIPDLTSDEVGRIAHEAGVQLAELTQRHASLEDAYMHSTMDKAQYVAPEENRA